MNREQGKKVSNLKAQKNTDNDNNGRRAYKKKSTMEKEKNILFWTLRSSRNWDGYNNKDWLGNFGVSKNCLMKVKIIKLLLTTYIKLERNLTIHEKLPKIFKHLSKK